MHQKVDVPISAIYFANHFSRRFQPYRIRWDGHVYNVTKLGLHHTERIGRTLMHVFTFDTETVSFKIQFNTDTLETRLLEIHDGEVN